MLTTDHKKNILAVEAIAETIRSSMRTTGIDKMVINPDGDVAVICNGGIIILRLLKVFRELSAILHALLKDSACVEWMEVSTVIKLTWWNPIGNSMRTLFIMQILAKLDVIMIVMQEHTSPVFVMNCMIFGAMVAGFTMVFPTTEYRCGISRASTATRKDDSPAPNLLAAGMVLGVMGLIGIPLDIMTITIAAIVVGIGVDDCIHYVHRFMLEFEVDRNYRAAMFRCHNSIGRAMYYTTVTVVVGFSMLTLSSFTPSIYFGLLTVMAMVAAVLGALLLLPLLIVLVKPLGAEGS